MAQHIYTESTTELFHELVSAAIDHQNLESSRDSVRYLVHVLDAFVCPERNESGLEASWGTPVAQLFLEAFHNTGMEHFSRLKLSGDLALFTAGFFSDQLQTKAVDVDYYCRLGGSAYACAADSCRSPETATLFVELSRRFAAFVDVLTEVSEVCALTDADNDPRLLELWSLTNSRYRREQLRKRGILVVPGSEMVH